MVITVNSVLAHQYLIVNMSHSADLSTALELTMDDEHEAKFVALKNLQTKKLKSLMTSIDAKDKEIAKLKILGKDNRRAQMIQELRKKIRTHETINDIIKEELQKRTEATVEDVNNLIIRKTLAGPKRFRPLSREELENKIFELEKKVNKKVGNGTASATPAGNVNGSYDAKAESTAQPKRPISNSSNGGTQQGEKVDEVGRFITLVEEIDDLRRTIRSKDAVVDAQKEEIIRLRSRNAQLIVVEEEAEYQERQYSELKAYNDSLLNNLEDTTNKLAEALEESLRVKTEALLENESRIAEIDALHAQNDKYMRQHAQLLANIAELEVEREKHTSKVVQSRQHTTTIESSIQQRDAEIRSLEEKNARLEEKLRACEKKCIQLTKDVAQVDVLKEQLREKNIAYKELKRNLDEKMKIKSLAVSSSGILPSNFAEAKEEHGDTAVHGASAARGEGKAEK